MKKIFLFTIYLLVCFSSSAYASGTISGVVYAPDGTELSNVNIQVEKTELGAVSGADGSFLLRGIPSGEYILIVKHVLYETERVSVNVVDGRTITSKLQFKQIKSYSLSEVVVTATKYKTEPEKVPQSVTLISNEEVEKGGYYNVGEMLDFVPGVRIIRSDAGAAGSSQGVSIRSLNGGPSSSKSLVLIDGRPVNEPWSGGISFHSIPAEMVDRVEVVKGPGSALYGSQATGGVISVFTKNPKRGFNGWVSAGYEMKGAGEITDSNTDGYGRADFNASNLRFNGSYGGINTNHIFSLGIRNSKNSYYSANANDKWSNYNLYYKLNHRFSEAFLSRITATVHKDTWDNRTSSVPNKNTQDVYSLDFFNKWQRETGILTGRIYVNHTISTDKNLAADTDLSNKMFRMGINTDYTMLFPEQNASLIFGIDGIYDHANIDYEKAVLEMSFTGQDSVDIYNSKTSTWSREWADVYSGVYGSNNQDHSQYNFALYTQYSKTIAKKLNIVLGGRFDLHKEFGSVFNPKIGIAYEVINIKNFTTNIKVNAATGFRSPPLWGWYSKSLGGYGSSNIVPEKSTNFDIGIFERFGNFGYIELTYFKMNVKDLIVNDKQGSTGYGQYVYLPDVDNPASFNLRKNLGDYSPSGFEAGFKIRPHKQLTLMGAYTYTNPEDFTFQTSQHRYNVGVNAYQPVGKNFSLESGFRYNYTGDGYFFDYKSRPYNAFATSDARISLNAYNNYKFSVYGKNLFDTKYKLWHYSWQPGRTFILQFEVKM